MYRTNNCGELRITDENKKVTIENELTSINLDFINENEKS